MNQLQRDTVQRSLPGFKTIGYEGKGDSAMRVDQLKPGAYLEKKIKGYTVPTFDDLLRGLKFVPTGPDARGLTQCLTWYLEICDTFQPRLDLNVLHAQALIRALKMPSQPVGTQDLNRYALQHWREDKGFKKIDTVNKGPRETYEGRKEEIASKSASERAVVNIRTETIRTEVSIPLRNILAFPFLALHGVVSAGLKMGIDKAEQRRATRKGVAMPSIQVTPTKPAMDVQVDAVYRQKYTLKRLRGAEYGESSTPEQTPKRQRKLDNGSSVLELRTPKQPTVSPITPRAVALQPRITEPRGSLVKLEFGLRQRRPAHSKF